MKMGVIRSVAIGIVILGGVLRCEELLAQQYQGKTIRVVIPFAPGGEADVLVRLLAKPVQGNLNQNLVVDNRPGAGGLPGAQLVMAKDGIDPVGSTPTELNAYFKSEVVKYATVIKRGNVRVD
jgi:tripartite-type tricarboxylate transporter receptor subunit TctC